MSVITAPFSERSEGYRGRSEEASERGQEGTGRDKRDRRETKSKPKRRAARAVKARTAPGREDGRKRAGSAFGEALELAKGHLRLPVLLEKAAAGVVLERFRERGVESKVHLAQCRDEVGFEGLGHKLGSAEEVAGV